MSQEQPPVRSRRELRQSRDEKKVAGPPAPGQLSPASKQRRVSDTPVDSVPEQTPAERSSQIRARDRAALRAIKELEEKEGQLSAGGPPTRRQLRLQQLKEQAVTSANPVVAPAGQPAAGQQGPGQPRVAPPSANSSTSTEAASPESRLPAGMSVEQALAARSLIAEQAKNQLAKMEHIASMDPEAVDPDILAEQIALAERAAILNRRAMAKQKLAEQAEPATSSLGSTTSPRPASQPAATRPGPATAANLAMVTPLEFVQVPGIDRPVMKPAATSHVPVVTQPGQKVRSGGKGRRPSGTPKQTSAGAAPAAPSGRSRVIARAEAAARAAAEPKQAAPAVTRQQVTEPDDLFADLPRIPASSAHGLEPLDAATAGLARAKRLRLMQV
ncbi:hypothetical protein, partial [Arthrobacter sp. HMWF013]|uniref:hypothetical protein n=1 Tax=Arthrobacter sp. HMWF013 TaxID=2056849 RepID=UPI001C6326B7